MESGTTTGTPKATKKVRGEGGGREIQKDLSARLYSKYGLLGGDRYTPATISKSLKLKPYGIPVDANRPRSPSKLLSANEFPPASELAPPIEHSSKRNSSYDLDTLDIKTETAALVETSKKALDEKNLKTLTTIAVGYWGQGRWKEAEELGVQILEVTKRVFGEEHRDTLVSMNNLMMIFMYQGRWKEAGEMGLRVLEVSKRVFGEEHPNTLATMANLAMTFRNQGRWKEAEEFGLQVLEVNKRVLGEEHPNTLTVIAHLAVTFQGQGRWKKAEEFWLQVLEVSKKVFGEEHPKTLTTMASLVVTFRSQDRLKEAEELGLQVLEASKRVLGEGHPNTLTTMANLAMTFRSQNRLKEAEAFGVQVLEASKRVLGKEHLYTLAAMANLAVTFQSQGRWEEAEKLGAETLERRKRVLGEKHPDTLASMADLALASSNKDRRGRPENDTLQPSYLGGFHDPVESVALSFCHSHELALSIGAAYGGLPKEAVDRRLRSLLHIYSNALLITASTPAEKDASLLVRSKAREISLRIEHHLKNPIRIGAHREELDKIPLGLRGTGVIGSENCFSQGSEEGISDSDLLVQETQSFLVCGPVFRRLVELVKALPAPKAQWKIEMEKYQRLLGAPGEPLPHPEEELGVSTMAIERKGVESEGDGLSLSGPSANCVPKSAEDLNVTSMVELQKVVDTERKSPVTILEPSDQALGDVPKFVEDLSVPSVVELQKVVDTERKPPVTILEPSDQALEDAPRPAEDLNAPSVVELQKVVGIERKPPVTILELSDQALEDVPRFVEDLNSSSVVELQKVVDTGRKSPATILEPNDQALEEAHVPGSWPQEPHFGTHQGIEFQPYLLSWFDHVGAWAEKKLGTQIYWWPLSTPIYPKDRDLVRMSWKCTCGKVLSSVISSEIAERYQQFYALSAPQNTVSDTLQLPTRSNSSASQSTNVLPSRPSAVLASFGHLLPQQTVTIPANPTNNQTQGSGVRASTFILCCIRKASIRKRQRRTVLAQVPKSPSTNDREFFQTLRLEYYRVKGWKRWISLSTVTRIRFVKFVRYYRDYVACYDLEELPLATDQNYEYVPKPPNNPPLFPVEEFLHYFEDPSCAGTATDCLDLMPKKVTGKLASGRVEAWGIQTRENISSLRFCILLLVVWLSTVAFAAWWLVRYKGDLQNAFTPAAYAAGLAAVCVVIPEALQFYSDHSARL